MVGDRYPVVRLEEMADDKRDVNAGGNDALKCQDHGGQYLTTKDENGNVNKEPVIKN